MSHFGGCGDMEVTTATQPEGSHSSANALALRDKFRMAMELFEVLEHQVAHETITAALTGSMRRSRKNARNQRKATWLSSTSNCEYGLGHLIGNTGLKFIKF